MKVEAFFLTENIFSWLDTDYCSCGWCRAKSQHWRNLISHLRTISPKISIFHWFFYSMFLQFFKKDMWRLQKDIWKLNDILGLMRCKILHFDTLSRKKVFALPPACHPPPVNLNVSNFISLLYSDSNRTRRSQNNKCKYNNHNNNIWIYKYINFGLLIEVFVKYPTPINISNTFPNLTCYLLFKSRLSTYL